tara:strand:- start:591 stop:1058 length:468 start_codon:yes stop_codon:yes gene_type:complete
MIKADVLITNKNWIKRIKSPNFYVNKKLKKIGKKNNPFKKNNFSFTILLSGDSEVRKLNIKFRNRKNTTDILSFPFHEKFSLNELLKKKTKKIYLGDIIINLNKINYKTEDGDFFLNFDKIWIHGLVHLLGYRHKSNFDFSIMKKVENKLLRSIR